MFIDCTIKYYAKPVRSETIIQQIKLHVYKQDFNMAPPMSKHKYYHVYVFSIIIFNY